MSRYSNQMNIPLPLAVFLATDDYDYDPTAISQELQINGLIYNAIQAAVNP